LTFTKTISQTPTKTKTPTKTSTKTATPVGGIPTDTPIPTQTPIPTGTTAPVLAGSWSFETTSDTYPILDSSAQHNDGTFTGTLQFGNGATGYGVILGANKYVT